LEGAGSAATVTQTCAKVAGGWVIMSVEMITLGRGLATTVKIATGKVL